MGFDESVDALKSIIVLCVLLFVLWIILEIYTIVVGVVEFVSKVLQFISSILPWIIGILIICFLIMVYDIRQKSKKIEARDRRKRRI